jgi:hypothetical protein
MSTLPDCLNQIAYEDYPPPVIKPLPTPSARILKQGRYWYWRAMEKQRAQERREQQRMEEITW